MVRKINQIIAGTPLDGRYLEALRLVVQALPLPEVDRKIILSAVEQRADVTRDNNNHVRQRIKRAIECSIIRTSEERAAKRNKDRIYMAQYRAKKTIAKTKAKATGNAS